MGNLHLRFDEGRVGRSLGCHPLVYSTGSVQSPFQSRDREGVGNEVCEEDVMVFAKRRTKPLQAALQSSQAPRVKRAQDSH